MEPARQDRGAGPTAADVAFGLVVLASAAFFVHASRGSWFFADEWVLARRGGSATDYLRPYNGHLSVVYIAVYQALFAAFELRRYLPFRVVGIACFCAVPVAVHLVARRRVGTVVSALLATMVLWFRGADLEPGALNHWLALAATVVVAGALLSSSRRADWVVFGALAFALCSAGGGTAAAAGAVVFLFCTRPHTRRWLAVLVPSVAWGLWWLVEGRGSTEVPESVRYGLADAARVTWEGIRSSFDGLALGSQPVGLVLTVLFGALLVWRLRRGPAFAATHLAWTAGLVAWWGGVIFSRGALAQTDVFRYQFVGATLIVLAVLPVEPARWRDRVPTLPGAVAVLVVAALVAAVNADDVTDWGDRQRVFGKATRQLVLVLSVEPAIDVQVTGGLIAIRPDEYRRALDRWGEPVPVTRATLDARLVETGIHLAPAGRAPAGCVAGPAVRTVGPQARLALAAGDRPVEVEVRRFGDRFVPVGRIGAGRSATLALPGLGAADPWQIRARGACRSG